MQVSQKNDLETACRIVQVSANIQRKSLSRGADKTIQQRIQVVQSRKCCRFIDIKQGMKLLAVCSMLYALLIVILTIIMLVRLVNVKDDALN